MFIWDVGVGADERTCSTFCLNAWSDPWFFVCLFVCSFFVCFLCCFFFFRVVVFCVVFFCLFFFSPDKAQTLWCTLDNRTASKPMPAVTFDGAVVEGTGHLRYLGIHFDRMMTYRKHVELKH